MGKTCDEKCVYSVSLEFGSDVKATWSFLKTVKWFLTHVPSKGLVSHVRNAHMWTKLQCLLRQVLKLIISNITGRLDFAFKNNFIPSAGQVRGPRLITRDVESTCSWRRSVTRKLPVVTKDDGVQQPKQGRADLNGTAFVKSFPQLSNIVALKNGVSNRFSQWRNRASTVQIQLLQMLHRINQAKVNSTNWHQVSETFSYIISL